MYYVFATDEKHSSAVLNNYLLVFFVKSQLVGVGTIVERDQSVPAQMTPEQVGFGSQTGRLLFFLGKPRT